MSAPADTFTAGSRARSALLAELHAAQIDRASTDVGSFFPQPDGVLIGLPALVARGVASRTFDVQVLVVSGDPLNSPFATDRLIALADDVARALATDNYRPSSWRSSVNAEPLPALELTVRVTVTEVESEEA